jgi:2,3-bisphosphoglycerate-dependent phosphoglycerate mutase
MHQFVFLRHGQSVWNADKRFTGWTDVELSARGIAEARAAAATLRSNGYRFDVCFTSALRRAAETARILLETMGLGGIPVHNSWRLNERHYGALQGLSFWRSVRSYGPAAVLRCQREFAAAPPLLAEDDPRFPGNDARYAGVDRASLPRGESLADTLERLRPYWDEIIAPEIRLGRRVIIVAHRNSLRALVKYLQGTSDARAARIKVPTGIPQICELDESMHVLRHFSLGPGR